jgi:glutamate racemase
LIGTEVTVASCSYDRAMAAVRPDIKLIGSACPAFVDFVERGDTTSEELVRIAEDYLRPLQRAGVDTLILGCTHYPLLSGVIQYVMGEEVLLVSSAEVTAKEVYAQLRESDALGDVAEPGSHRFVASSEGYFSELGRRFLGPEFGEVEYRPWDRA